MKLPFYRAADSATISRYTHIFPPPLGSSCFELTMEANKDLILSPKTSFRTETPHMVFFVGNLRDAFNMK